VGTNAFLVLKAAPAIAEWMAPELVPWTSEKEAAVKREAQQAEDERVAAEKKKCAQFSSDKSLREACLDGAEFIGRYIAGRYDIPHYERPERAHRRDEIEPRIELLTERVFPGIFGLLYLIITWIFLRDLWCWWRATALSVLQSYSRRLHLWAKQTSAYSQNRRISAAAKQLEELETVYARGMISEDVYQMKLAEIKARLAASTPG